MKHKINKKASVEGLKKIWVFHELAEVDEEECSHYHVRCKEHPAFIVMKKFLKVDMDGNGVYAGADDFSGTMIYTNKDESFMDGMFQFLGLKR
jgi:uncharacterized protein (DUF2225 family)